MVREVLEPMLEEKPPWLKVRYSYSEGLSKTRELNRRLGLVMVCDSAHCPNLSYCWKTRSGTYLILGDRCTRHCSFCAVEQGCPRVQDPDEPKRIAQAVHTADLRYVVITSVTRDDLLDGGASFFAHTVKAIRDKAPSCRIELLIPDLQGSKEALATIISSEPDVMGHNIEVVRRLQSMVRDHRASYHTSLEILRTIKELEPDQLSKSSIMLGLGESREEVSECLQDLNGAGVDILTVGQYLRPSQQQYPVHRYVPPEEFEEVKQEALHLGIKAVMAGPFVRSSYKAHEAYQMAKGE